MNDGSFEKKATDALISHDQLKRKAAAYVPKLRVWDAVKLHKTLKKSSGFSDKAFMEAAQEMFPHSTYFHAN